MSTRSFLRRFAEVHSRLGLLPEGTVGHPDEQVALVVRLDDAELDLKRKALAAHASQTDALAVAMGWTTAKPYRRGW